MKQGYDFTPITKEMEEKLLVFIRTDSIVNWKIAFKLLRSIRGIGRHTAEEWIYNALINHQEISSYDDLNKFIGETFKLKKRSSFSYWNSFSRVFPNNSRYGKSGMTTANKNSFISTGKSYQWKLS